MKETTIKIHNLLGRAVFLGTFLTAGLLSMAISAQGFIVSLVLTPSIGDLGATLVAIFFIYAFTLMTCLLFMFFAVIKAKKAWDKENNK